MTATRSLLIDVIMEPFFRLFRSPTRDFNNDCFCFVVGECGDSSGASGVCSAVGSVASGSSSGASSAGSDDYMSAAQLQACRRNLGVYLRNSLGWQ